MSTFITVIHVIACILLVLVVMIQSGKGAEISASLGGSSQTVFGSSGGANFFTRFTSAMAAIFMLTSVALTVLQGEERKSVFEGATPVTDASKQQPAAPAADAPAAQQQAAPAAPAAQQPAAPAPDKK